VAAQLARRLVRACNVCGVLSSLSQTGAGQDTTHNNTGKTKDKIETFIFYANKSIKIAAITIKQTELTDALP
jgi:hypothetical protein